MRRLEKIFICCALAFPQAGFSEDRPLPALHIHYNKQMSVREMVYAYKPGCDELYKVGLYKTAWKVIGDESLLGQGTEDVYWAYNGGYRVTYKMMYVAKGVGICQYQVAPEIEVNYENFITRKKHTYKRTYKDWKQSATKGKWAELNAFRSGLAPNIDGFDKETWRVSTLQEGANLVATGMLKALWVGPRAPEKLGKEIVAGQSCEMLTFTGTGMKNYSCVWNPKAANLPDNILLKGFLAIAKGHTVTSTAEQVNENVTVPLNVLLPAAVWRNYDKGSYLRSKKTKGEWFDDKQQKELKREERQNKKKEKQKQ